MSEKIETRIAQLLAKAESTTPEEAEALTAKAEELMIKYGIEQAIIDARRAKAGGKREEIVTKGVFYSGSYSVGMIGLAGYIVRAFGTLRAYVYRNTWEGNVKGDRYMIVGFESDVEQCMVLLASLQMQARVALDAWWKARYTANLSANEKFMERRSFLFRFGEGAGVRFKEMHQRVVAESEPGAEVALVDRGRLVEESMADLNLTKSRPLMGRSAGSAAGFKAGRNANVGGKAFGGSAKAVGS